MLTGCIASNSQVNSEKSKNSILGWVHGECLAIENNNLVLGDKITVIGVIEGHKITKATIGENATSSDNCYALLEDRKEINTSSGYTFYLVEGIPNISTFGLSIVLVGNQPDLVISEGVAYADINGDGFRDRFGQCSTSEGVSFYILSGNSSEATKIWEGYYYLGYDSEVTCP